MITIDESQIRRIMPRCADATSWTGILNRTMPRFGIDTPTRAAAFLARVAHESGDLQRLVENLNYSDKGLIGTWPNRFDATRAQQLARNPERIANYVYANRLGNGDEASGDGWRFRGCGLIQVTGRINYRSVGQTLAIALETTPELLQQPEPAALSAGLFWQSHGLNELADHRLNDDDDEDFVTITKRINGGRAGLAERKSYWALAKGCFA